MEKQLTEACGCFFVPIAAQAMTDGLAETEDALVTNHDEIYNRPRTVVILKAEYS